MSDTVYAIHVTSYGTITVDTERFMPEAFWSFDQATEWALRHAHTVVDCKNGTLTRHEVDTSYAHRGVILIVMPDLVNRFFKRTMRVRKYEVVGLRVNGTVLDRLAEIGSRQPSLWSRIKEAIA